MSLQKEISRWDGKSVIDIDAIYDCYSHEESFYFEVIKFIKHILQCMLSMPALKPEKKMIEEFFKSMVIQIGFTNFRCNIQSIKKGQKTL